MANKKRVTLVDVQKVIDALGLGTQIDKSELAKGIRVEYEHGTGRKSDAGAPSTNATNDDLITTGKIAVAHLKEIPDYYTRLALMEKQAGGRDIRPHSPSITQKRPKLKR